MGRAPPRNGERRVRLPRARVAKIPPFMAIEMGSFAGLLLLGEAIVGGMLGRRSGW